MLANTTAHYGFNRCFKALYVLKLEEHIAMFLLSLNGNYNVLKKSTKITTNQAQILTKFWGRTFYSKCITFNLISFETYHKIIWFPLPNVKTNTLSFHFSLSVYYHHSAWKKSVYEHQSHINVSTLRKQRSSLSLLDFGSITLIYS